MIDLHAFGQVKYISFTEKINRNRSHLRSRSRAWQCHWRRPDVPPWASTCRRWWAAAPSQRDGGRAPFGTTTGWTSGETAAPANICPAQVSLQGSCCAAEPVPGSLPGIIFVQHNILVFLHIVLCGDLCIWYCVCVWCFFFQLQPYKTPTTTYSLIISACRANSRRKKSEKNLDLKKPAWTFLTSRWDMSSPVPLPVSDRSCIG